MKLQMNKFSLGFWNYVEMGILKNKNAVSDWKELGLNLAMSFEFDYKKHKKQQMIDLLNQCKKNGLKVIICDSRTNFRNYKKLGPMLFTEEVRQAYKDFGSHPAVFGFHIGDEPLKDDFEASINAYNIVKEEMPSLTPFINLFPYFLDESFEDLLGCKKENYQEKIEYFLEKTHANVLSYDCYSQCATFEKDIYLEMYFKNLKIFSEACKKYGAQLFTSLLSVGHWAYRVPTEDDLRWQISTAIAHNCVGLLWFFIYERDLDGSYRMSPIDCFYNKTSTFDSLKRQNNIFAKYFAPLLEEYNFVDVQHFGHCYGGFDKFKASQLLKNIEVVINPEPFSISYFKNKNNEDCVVIVNMSQENPSCIKPEFTGDFAKYNVNHWFAPGQMMVFTKDRKQ